MIRLQNVSKNFPNKKILNDFSMEFSESRFTCILGPSGCGKSTLLKLIAGLEKPDTGSIDNIQNKKTSFVFQDPALIPWLSVKENILLALSSDKSILSSEKEQRLADIIALVKLQGNESLFPHQLSGGMKMRVSIARALINEPQILLMDEPFSALDELVRFELQEELWQLWTKKKMNIFFVTHAISEAVFLSDQILLFNKNKIINFPNQINFERVESLRNHSQYQQQIQLLTAKVREEARNVQK